MATKQDIQHTIENFKNNFQTDAFLAFDSKCAINFMGNILVNYKGLRVIKFNKTQYMIQFNPQQFKQICQGSNTIKNLEEARETLFNQLKQKYPDCSCCVISGQLYESTGELSSYKSKNVSAFLY